MGEAAFKTTAGPDPKSESVAKFAWDKRRL